MPIVAKSLLDLTEEEILKALETAEDTKSSINPITDFIMRFGVKTGQSRVTAHFLYQAYLLYYPKNATLTEFNKEISKHIKYKNQHFYVNKEFVDNHSEFKSIKKKPNNTENIRKHFVAFIKNLSIEKGNNSVPAIIFYDIYRKYCTSNTKKHYSLDTFKTYMNLIFESLPSNDYLVLYCLDKNTASITPNKDYIEIRKTYEEKEVTKRQNQVSSSRSKRKLKKSN